MRKLLLFVAGAIVALAAEAVPALPTPIQVIQPDGTKLTIRIVGDEFFNYQTTADGYTIVRNEAGYFVYAQSQNDDLVPSNVIAHNEAERSASEAQFVNTLEKGIISKVDARNGKLKRAPVDAATQAASLKNYDYNNFRGLIILVDYYDCQFSRSDMQDFYYRMANEVNYTGFTNEDGTPNNYGACTGSLRDYYTDNSQGRFIPTFDVVGPITLANYSVDYHEKWNHTGEIWAAALNQINPQVDFSQYDTDNDGNIDMIYFIGAGSGSNSDGSQTHLWPHKSDLYWENVVLDGKRARTYACSTEYVYPVYYGVLDGIGTICHEFSHVLGLPDLYDTDYEDNGGQSQHPGDWDIMAGGSYQNNSRTPVAYSLYDRYSLGFANAQVINATGTYSLNQIGSTGEGYIINSPEPQVKFYIENRQNTRWDAYAPGHGMIICRVDSTNASIWDSNEVNCYPAHNYYVLLRAGNGTETAQASDAFPAGASLITNSTTPNLLTWNGNPCQYNITSIQENNGVIIFNVGDDNSLHSIVEDFEEMAVTSAAPEDDVQGVYSKWKFVNCYVTNPGSTYCNGEHAAAMKRPSSLTMTQDVRYMSYMVSFKAYNNSGTTAKLILYCSTDKGNTWNAIANINGDTNSSVGGNTDATFNYTFDMTEPARYRISMSAGPNTNKVYIDDFTIYYTDIIPYTGTPLATILNEGVDGNEYLVADDLSVVEVVPSDGLAFLSDGLDNWIKVDAGSYYNTLASMNTVACGTLKGVFTGKEFIPTITLAEAPEAAPYEFIITPKTYNLAEPFAPKVNEVINVGGYYNANDNALRAYSVYPQGQSVSLDCSWMSGWTPVDGTYYNMFGIVQIKEPWSSAAPMLMEYDYPFQNYVLYALSSSIPTAVESLNMDKNDALVNVYNMQGQLIKQGVNANIATQGLRPGIYLIGGKKVVVK
ncbi:MAG: M6 family metalloprotease domain-containing protein [Muribaculaceae bacterium]|nr:M6 family metalloprotease domain-containing protein [Muribaculaceae bacterium]MBR5171420.1 M6 family metalloprotease domain-containing protein [Muribaculaceae bacterium]